MADKANQFEGVVESLLGGMNTVLSTKTVVGEPTQVGDTIILPLVDVSFGIGAGSGTNGAKTSGAGGIGGKMTLSGGQVFDINDQPHSIKYYNKYFTHTVSSTLIIF